MLGVILAGGFGTRLKPFTSVSNKHLAPLYSLKDGATPMIHYPIRTLRDSGVKEILIISSREHSGDIIQHLGDGDELGVNLTYKIQEMNRSPTGIAQALKLAQHFVGNNNFAVVLGDNFYENTFEYEFKDFDKWFKPNEVAANVFLKEVHDPHRFGVATVDTSNHNKIIKIVEKPKVPETNLAVTGLYLYTPKVFDLLPLFKPSKRGELEITDVNNWYVEQGKMRSNILSGFWHDMGTPESMLHTQNFINK
jgi:glucose-1-phosphate thymidylyltransferase